MKDMSRKEFITELKQHGACDDALYWIRRHWRLSPRQAVLACPNRFWLWWLADGIPGKREQIARADAFLNQLPWDSGGGLHLAYVAAMILDNWKYVVKSLRK